MAAGNCVSPHMAAGNGLHSPSRAALPNQFATCALPMYILAMCKLLTSLKSLTYTAMT